MSPVELAVAVASPVADPPTAVAVAVAVAAQNPQQSALVQKVHGHGTTVSLTMHLQVHKKAAVSSLARMPDLPYSTQASCNATCSECRQLLRRGPHRWPAASALTGTAAPTVLMTKRGQRRKLTPG